MKKQRFDVLQLEHLNQYVIIVNDEIIFKSYDSLIASYNQKKNKLVFDEDWDYSKTTLKHLYLFLQRYCIDYHGIANALNSRNIKKSLAGLLKLNVIKKGCIA